MKRSDFHYDLPPELIAQEARPRGGSRMMIVRLPGGEIEHSRFARFPALLKKGDVLVLNDTRVFPARLLARPLGNMKRPVEVLLTRERDALQWDALCRPARRVRTGDRLEFSDRLRAEVTGKKGGEISLQFEIDAADPAEAFWQEVESVGAAPLPPYIRRDQPDARDRERYQTVYAEKRGAIAAPTAGLHFTEQILEEIEKKGVEVVRLTLHVGLGTFEPVKVEEIAQHRMHEEQYAIPGAAASAINRALDEGRRVVAVGTTVVRALESAAHAPGGRVASGEGSTDIFITPGVRFRVVGALLTNFHLPESTLLMLVSAFAGVDTIRVAYREAVRERYLFFSYGDCMFLAK